MFSTPTLLADPPVCSGLLELAAVVSSRTVRDLPIAAFVVWVNRAMAVAGLVLFVLAVRAVYRDRLGVLAACSVAAALLFTPPFRFVLAPMAAAPFAAAAAVLLAITSADERLRLRPRRLAAAVTGLAALAAMAPTLWIACAIVSAALALRAELKPTRRLVWVAVAILAAVIGPAAISAAVPPLTVVGDVTSASLSCGLPSAGPERSLTAALSHAFGRVTAFAAPLLALGVFAVRRQWRDARALLAVAAAALPAILAAAGAHDPIRTLAPLLLISTFVIAFGMREVLVAVAPRALRWIPAAIIIVALPWLQWSERSRWPPVPGDVGRGHAHLSRVGFLQIAAAIPSGGALVVEDAITAIAALDANRRLTAAGRPLIFVARHPAALTTADRPLMALPRGQAVARSLGFGLKPMGDRAPGLAALERLAPCTIADHTWRDAPGLTRVMRLAVVAPDNTAIGPVMFYFGSDQRLRPARHEWPSRAERGFAWRDFDRDRPDSRAELDDALTRLDLPASHPVFQRRFVTRLEVWRVPGGPLALRVGLDALPAAVALRLRPDARNAPLYVCPASDDEIIAIGEK